MTMMSSLTMHALTSCQTPFSISSSHCIRGIPMTSLSRVQGLNRSCKKCGDCEGECQKQHWEKSRQARITSKKSIEARRILLEHGGQWLG